MKTIKNKLATIILSGFALSIALSSCQKKFDASSYAPPKPPPSYGGYVTSSEVASSNLAAHWAFNGSYVDSVSSIAASPTDTLGNSSPGISFGKGLLGQAVTLPGTATYLVSNVPSNIQNLHSFSISLWVNMPVPANLNQAIGLISIPNSPNFWSCLDIYFNGGNTSSTGNLNIHLNDNSTSTAGADAWLTGTVVANPWGAWTNITLTYDDTQSLFIIYYQGKPTTGGANKNGAFTVTGFAPLNWTGAKNVIFGTFPFQAKPSLTTGANTGNYGGWAGYVNGTVDEVRVYNTTLTATEVNALYNLQLAGR
jgi:hypothetical protein